MLSVIASAVAVVLVVASSYAIYQLVVRGDDILIPEDSLQTYEINSLEDIDKALLELDSISGANLSIPELESVETKL